MVIKTYIVNTMPRRSAEDIVTQEGGVLRSRTTDAVEAPEAIWNPFQELHAEERIHVSVRRHVTTDYDPENIPSGLEGSYYL
jgi:hypothetical protein